MTKKLTKNESLVLSVLEDEKAPLSAYTILDRLRHEGLRAPLQIYRALEKLMETKRVHRLESVNAFMVCTHPQHCNHQSITFTICDKCGKAQEIDDHDLADNIHRITKKQNFIPRLSHVEIRGVCYRCQNISI